METDTNNYANQNPTLAHTVRRARYKAVAGRSLAIDSKSITFHLLGVKKAAGRVAESGAPAVE